MNDTSSLKGIIAIAGQYPLLTRAEEISLLKQSRRPGRIGKQAAEKLLLSNLRLAVKIALDFSSSAGPNPVSVDDLVSEAVIGLQMAIPRFKQNYKNKLSTYAGFWMRQRVMRYIDNQKSVIRVPVHRSAQARKLMRVVADMAITLGREPTHEEVSEITGIPLKSIERAFAVQRPVMSLDAPVGDSEGGECSLGEIIPDDSVVSADTDLTNENDVDLVMEIVRKLPAREQAIFRRRCGFGRGGVPETLESIAKSFKITRERVRQLQNSTIEEIRKRVAQRNSPNYRDIHSLLAA